MRLVFLTAEPQRNGAYTFSVGLMSEVESLSFVLERDVFIFRNIVYKSNNNFGDLQWLNSIMV